MREPIHFIIIFRVASLVVDRSTTEKVLFLPSSPVGEEQDKATVF